MTEISPAGWLALVATPIGNLEDVTLRCLRTLREADLIAAEDTRRTRRLTEHFDISTPITAYHAFNEHRKTDKLLDAVIAGKKVAVVADAGTPAVSDPGFLIVRAAIDRGIEPMVVPGVSSLTFAVVAAGFPVDKFLFAGFPPTKPGKRKRFLQELQECEATFFIFEGPHRIPRLLREICNVLGPQTPVALIREATKMFEETVRGPAGQLAVDFADKKCKGEFVVAVNARPEHKESP